MDAFDNTKTNKEQDKFFDKIANKFVALKKLLKIVSNDTEEKIINNVIKGAEFVLDYALSLDDGKTDFSIFDFSHTKELGLNILTPNQTLRR